MACGRKAGIWVSDFTKWYNINHHHSGLNFLTPNQRHDGRGKEILTNRTAVYEAARAKNPERWSKEIRDWFHDDRIWLNLENRNLREKRGNITNLLRKT